MTDIDIKQAASALGRMTSDRKKLSSANNGKDQRPHVLKVNHFESIFPYELTNNEWKDTFEIDMLTKITKKKATYNPDYWCEYLNCYIEVTTSKPNISEQKSRWISALILGLKLKIYWWEGQDITEQIYPQVNSIKQSSPPQPICKKGGRPKKIKWKSCEPPYIIKIDLEEIA